MGFMVQGHLCDTLLSKALEETGVFQRYWLLRGITGPLFFTLAGFAFAVASDADWETYRRRGPLLTARIRRIGALLLWGSFLQMPRWSGRPPFDFTGDEWRYLLRCGVLQCMAFSLALAHLLLCLGRSKRGFALAAAGVAVSAVGLAPVIAATELPSLASTALGLLLRTNEGSSFPLLPWVAHFLLGAALARLHLDAAWLGTPRRLGLLVGALGALLLAVGHGWRVVEPSRLSAPSYWFVDPSLFLTRAGGAWCAFSLVTLSTGGWGGAPRALRDVSSRALSIYVLHLVLLWGGPGTPGLVQRIGPTLSLGQTFAAGPVLLVICAALAVGFGAAFSRLRVAVSSVADAARRSPIGANPDQGGDLHSE
jgi:hypothetical protein